MASENTFNDRRKTDADIREMRGDIKQLISVTSKLSANASELFNSVERLVGGMEKMDKHIHDDNMHHCVENAKIIRELKKYYEDMQLKQAEFSGVKKGVTMSYKTISAIVAGITAFVSFLIANADKIKGFFGV